MKSLVYHVKLSDGIREDAPTESVRRSILRRGWELFREASWSIPDDFMQRTHYSRVVAQLDWTSSPGYPYMRNYPTNRDMFKPDLLGQVNPVREELVWQMVQTRLRERDSDPIRLFIKPEPHKLKKIENHRYRLISAVSVVDQIIDAMLHGECNQRMTEVWPYVPSKSGWSPTNGGYRYIPLRKWMATDKSGWDWTVRPWLIELTRDLRKMLCQNVEEHPLWWELVLWRYEQLYAHPVFINSYGWLMQQKRPGVQKSGCFNTLSDNCIQQVLLHLRVSKELGIRPLPMMCMGDDVYQEAPADVATYLQKLGEYCRVKSADVVPEFAGYRFMDGRIEPLYKGKHAFVLLHLDERYAQETLDSYTLMYHMSVERDFIRRLIRKMGYEVRPLEWCDEIMRG